MEPFISVDAPPASDWESARPDDLHPQFWAETRPTEETLAQLSLPDGRVVHGSDGQLLGWESGEVQDCDLGALWVSCAQRFSDTGLWPICDAWEVDPYRRWNGPGWDGKPYWRDPYRVPSDVYDAVNLPDRQDYFQEPDFGAEYFRELMEDSGLRDLTMTLARGSVLAEVPMARLVAPQTPERLTLVACRRPADAVFVLDFGVANDDATPGIFAGVLRSWESRFGVLPVLLRSAWTAFQVLAPPSDETDVERLASEVFAFAVDSGLQSGFFQRSQERRVSVQEMVQSREWLIWWD